MSTKEQQAFSCWAPQISLFILSVTKNMEVTLFCWKLV